VCTDDLAAQPSACDAADWSADYDPAATAFRAFVTFPATDLLGPGDSTALRFRMAAPPAPTNPEQTATAWNSFAHTDFFLDNGSIVQLPQTEPIKTGVALVYGGLSLTKAVVGEPTPEQAGPYGFEYECLVTPEVADGDPAAEPVIAASGTAQLTAGQTLDVTGIPARAQCAVWEPEPGGLISDAADRATAKQAVIPVDDVTGLPVNVIITNTVPEEEPPTTDPTDPTVTTEPTTPTDPTGSTDPTATTDTTATTGSSATTGSTGSSGTIATTTVTAYPGGGYGAGGGSSYLPNTGVDVAWFLRIALLLFAAGSAALLTARYSRRRYRGSH